jgi:dihydrofolate reductase
MSTIAINTFLTLDGVAQSPGMPEEDPSNGFIHGGWQAPLFTEDLGPIIGSWHASAGGLLLGRRTYEILAAYWSTVPADHEFASFAKVLNELPKYVATTTLDTAGWGPSTVLDGDVVDAVTALKEQDLGELLVIGSLDFAQTLIRHNLVDEYRLAVFPVVLGTGKKLFGGGAVPAGLTLVSSQTTEAGVFAGVYRPAGAPVYGSHALD